jgi:hypothetical protein
MIDMVALSPYNVRMDNNGQLPDKKTDDTRWPLIQQALELFYSGRSGSLTTAVEMIDGLARSTLYLYREKFPDEYAELELAVRNAAVKERQATELAFAREQLERSIEAQRKASQAVLNQLPELVRIAQGEPKEYTVHVKGKDKPETRTVVPYPRDQLKATEILTGLAQDGLLAERGRGLAVVQAAKIEEEKKPPPPERPALNVPGLVGDFTSVRATTEDGSIVEASVRQPSLDVIDVETEP